MCVQYLRVDTRRGGGEVQLHLIVLSREPVKLLFFLSWLLISFIHKSNPNTVARLV